MRDVEVDVVAMVVVEEEVVTEMKTIPILGCDEIGETVIEKEVVKGGEVRLKILEKLLQVK